MLTSWTDLLGRMAARSSAAGDSAAELDIRQLRGLAARMDEEAFLPLRSDELGPESPRRMRGLRRLIDDATEGGREAGWVSTKGLNVTSQLHGYGRHLRLCGASAWFGINVDLWAHCGDNPLWLHFYAAKNASAVGLDEIRRALQLPHGVGRVAVDLSSGVTYDVGHVTDWSISVAVDLPLRVEYDAVLDAVVAQLEEIGRTINPRFE